MDTGTLLPPKRRRFSLNDHVQLTQCIREFKLPKQYPSRVPKLNDTNVGKWKVQRLQRAPKPEPRTPPIATKIIQNKETSLNNNIRTIKLKGEDGRDLGEVTVPDLPQNIRGKTIMISKNSIGKGPEPVSPVEKTKAIMIGVVSPVSIIKNEMPRLVKVESAPLSASSVLNNRKVNIADVSKEDNTTKRLPLPLEAKIITDSESPARPQVLVVQSGASWHMVKIPKNMQTNQLNGQIDRSICVAELPKSLGSGKANFVEIHSSKDQWCNNAATMAGDKKVPDNFPINRTLILGVQNRVDAQQWSQPQTESTRDRLKVKSPLKVESAATTKLNIEISRVYGSPAGTITPSLVTRQLNDTLKPNTTSDTATQKISSHIRQDVMVVLPSIKGADPVDPTSVNKNNHVSPSTIPGLTDSTRTTTSTEVTPAGQKSAWRRKILANKYHDTMKFLKSRDVSSLRQTENRSLGAGVKKNGTADLSILEKALSTVEDAVLREKALKVLAECGIGMERRIPVTPPTVMKSVNDSNTQTSIFGLWETDKFIHVSEDNPTVQRLQVTERTRNGSPKGIISSNPSAQELYINHFDVPNFECNELANMVEGYVKGSETAAQVANIFAKSSPICSRVIEQLEKDFDTYKKYDDDGLLNIHRAVVTDNARSVRRNLMVLRGCNESADIPTRGGQTSLELGVRYEVSPEIITMLLDAGAEPTSTDPAHDSALIIASRQSLPIMRELVSRVKMSSALDNFDSTGFAALHYCAQNGYHEGVETLVNAAADVNVRDRRSGRTPLFHAVESDHNNLAEMLLRRGADASIPNYGGQTIYNVVDESRHYNLLEVLHQAVAK